MFWFNNDLLGRYKLINKIERIISSLAANNNQTINDFIIKFRKCLFNQQSLSFMYDDVWHNREFYP